jgi:hypothetical protein
VNQTGNAVDLMVHCAFVLCVAAGAELLAAVVHAAFYVARQFGQYTNAFSRIVNLLSAVISVAPSDQLQSS